MPLYKPNEKDVIKLYNRKFKKIELTDRLTRTITIGIEYTIDELDRKYIALLRWDPTPREEAISDLHNQRAREKHKCKTQLIPDKTADEIDAEYQYKVNEAERELEHMMFERPDLSFKTTIKKVEYKQGNTYITLMVGSHSIIQELDEIKEKFISYKFALINREAAEELKRPIKLSDNPFV